MDKKLTYSGGEPNITIDNIMRDPIANRAALFGLLLGLGSTTDLAISGAVVALDPLVDADVTAGYVWLNGEVLQVDAAMVSETEGTDLWEFQKVVTFDALGDKTFNDAIPRQTYQKNRAVLVNVASITGFDAVNAPSLLDTIVDLKKSSTPQAKAGTDDNTVMTPAKVSDVLDGVVWKKLQITNWNMGADATKLIPHGLSDISDVVMCTAMILSDSKVINLPLVNGVNEVITGKVAVATTNVSLERFSVQWTSGSFDDTGDRGYVLLGILK